MDFKDIKELIEAIDNSSINEVEIKEDNFKIKLSKEKQVISNVAQPQLITQPSSVNTQLVQRESGPVVTEEDTSPEELADNMYVIKSPIVGTFYNSPSPDSDVYVKEGDKVSAGEVMCIVEAMKIMNEIKTDVDGQVHEILVENEDIVEYNQPLMIIRR